MQRGDADRRAIIVGAGPNGLAAGIVLAQAGWSVRLFEASETVGGGARSAELTEPGFIHDVCSAVYPLGLGSPLFRSLGLEKYGLEYIHPPLALAHPLDDDTAVVLDRSMQRTVETLDHAIDAQRHRARFEWLAEQWPVVAEEVLSPPHVPRSLARGRVLARFGVAGLRSADGFARSTYVGERARALFAGIAAHSTLPLNQPPSAAIGLLLAAAGHGVGWPIVRGGAQRLADALAALLRELGGEISTGQRIASLAALPKADAYLFDTAPLHLLPIAGDQLPTGYCRQLDRFRYGAGSFKVDWALSEPIPWRSEVCREAGTLHLGGSLDEIAAAEAAASRGEHAEQPFVLLSQPSVFDDRRAPAGEHTAWAYCHVPNGSTVDMTHRIEAQVERFAPGFGDVIIARHTMNAQELERRNANYVGGDINAGMPNLRQLLMRPAPRWSPHCTPNRRIFLCSSSTPPGGGVHGMCGYHAAQAVLRSMGGG